VTFFAVTRNLLTTSTIGEHSLVDQSRALLKRIRMTQPGPNDVNDVKQSINKRLKALWRETDCGYFPHVCLICDSFTKPSETSCLSIKMLECQKKLFEPSNWNAVDTALKDCYTYDGPIDDHDVATDDEYTWITSLLLSPRSLYIKQDDKKKEDGFTVCNVCKVTCTHCYAMVTDE